MDVDVRKGVALGGPSQVREPEPNFHLRYYHANAERLLPALRTKSGELLMLRETMPGDPGWHASGDPVQEKRPCRPTPEAWRACKGCMLLGWPCTVASPARRPRSMPPSCQLCGFGFLRVNKACCPATS